MAKFVSIGALKRVDGLKTQRFGTAAGSMCTNYNPLLLALCAFVDKIE